VLAHFLNLALLHRTVFYSKNRFPLINIDKNSAFGLGLSLQQNQMKNEAKIHRNLSKNANQSQVDKTY